MWSHDPVMADALSLWITSRLSYACWFLIFQRYTCSGVLRISQSIDSANINFFSTKSYMISVVIVSCFFISFSQKLFTHLSFDWLLYLIPYWVCVSKAPTMLKLGLYHCQPNHRCQYIFIALLENKHKINIRIIPQPVVTLKRPHTCRLVNSNNVSWGHETWLAIMLYPTTVNSLILNNNSSTKAIVGLLLLITKLELPIASIIQPRSILAFTCFATVPTPFWCSLCSRTFLSLSKLASENKKAFLHP